jgi:hypothetical protein
MKAMTGDLRPISTAALLALVAAVATACAKGDAVGAFGGGNGDDSGGGDSSFGSDDGSESQESALGDENSTPEASSGSGMDAGNEADGGGLVGSGGIDGGGMYDSSGMDVNAVIDSGSGAEGSMGGDGATDALVEAAPDSASDASCATSIVTDYCSFIPSLPAAPVIDGILDCGPALVAMTAEGWTGPSPLPAFPSGNSASIAAAWRSNGLYVYVQVTTPVVIAAETGSPPFDGSGAEVFVDSDGVYQNPPNYDNPGTIQLVAAAPQNTSTPARVGEGYRNAVDQGPWASTQFGTFPTSTGFVFEAFIVGTDLGVTNWLLASGNHIGFDIAVDVSYPTASTTGPQGHREGQYFLHVGASPIGEPYADPRAFCVPTLQ